MFNGNFTVGCNYWASDSGIDMWTDWNAQTVKIDLKNLADNGIDTIRVFPLWSVFQPIDFIREYVGRIQGVSVDNGKTLLYDTDESAGINNSAIEHFSEFLDIAEQNKINVMPALITGWMSGRLYAPAALKDKNLLTDPVAIKWEIRFCRYFVNKFKSRKNIIAWSLGNESNCCAKTETEEQAWLWTASIANAIRSSDPTRPVISGMHSLGIKGENNWNITAQGENCDVLTTHPYASPGYRTDNISGNDFRAVLHPACQTKIYRNISKKPCFIEETGTYGEMYMDEEMTAVYAKNCLFNAWAHNCMGYFWWISFDQGHLKYHPFGYNNRASNYGLLRQNYEPKPVMKAIKEFKNFLNSFKYKKLPSAKVDGICLLSENINSWAVASSTFYLAGQVGLNLDFAFIEDDLPDSNIYFLPSLSTNSVSINALEKLMEKVKNGAVLYVSAASGLLRNMSKDFGFRIKNRIEVTNATDNCVFKNNCSEFSLSLSFKRIFNIDLETAEALGVTSDGVPIFTSSVYGKGKIFYLGSELEKDLFSLPHAFENGYSQIYDIVKKASKVERIFDVNNTYVTVTEHKVNDNKWLIVAVNNSPNVSEIKFVPKRKTEKVELLYGEKITEEETAFTSKVNPNNALIFEVSL